jgi:hypothetical protein
MYRSITPCRPELSGDHGAVRGGSVGDHDDFLPFRPADDAPRRHVAGDRLSPV